MDVKTPPAGDQSELYVDSATVQPTAAEQAAEEAEARRLAERYRLPYVDVARFNIDHELFRSLPAELMLRDGSVRYRREGQPRVIVSPDPGALPMIDELSTLLATPVRAMVAAPSAI